MLSLRSGEVGGHMLVGGLFDLDCFDDASWSAGSIQREREHARFDRVVLLLLPAPEIGAGGRLGSGKHQLDQFVTQCWRISEGVHHYVIGAYIRPVRRLEESTDEFPYLIRPLHLFSRFPSVVGTLGGFVS